MAQKEGVRRREEGVVLKEKLLKKEAVVGVIGMGYVGLPLAKGAIVLYYDPYVESFERNWKVYRREPLTKELLESVDAVMITAAHKRDMDYEFVVRYSPFVFDTKNVTKNVKENREKIILL